MTTMNVQITVADDELDRLLKAAVGRYLTVPAVPAPGVPPPVIEHFDEAYYLAANGDVAEAVREGYFVSGFDHYIKHGKAEGRPGTRPIPTDPVPAPPPIPVPLPTVPPVNPSKPFVPEDNYPNEATLRAVLQRNAFDTAVTVDGKSIHSGFGPGIAYYTQPGGIVSRTKPAATGPTRGPGMPLLSSYASVESLLADAGEVRWDWAIVVDGNVVKAGFEADNGASLYRTINGRIARA